MPEVIIIGSHPEWRKIESIKALREATGCDIAQGKMIIDRAMGGHSPRVPAGSAVEAHRLAGKLAGLGAVTECEGHRYDAFPSAELHVPYRSRRIAEVEVVTACSEQDTLICRVTSGQVTAGQGSLAIPITESFSISVDFDSMRPVVQGVEFHVCFFRTETGDDSERLFWQHWLSEPGQILLDVFPPDD